MNMHQFPHSTLYLWTLVLSLITFISGLLTLGEGIGISTGLPVSPDIAGGFILLLLGIILMTGVYEGRNDRARWIQYGYTGILLLLIFGVCTILVNAANIIALMIEGETYDLFSILSSGFVWMALLALPAFSPIRNILFGCSQGGDFS